jgi:aquaporin Z
MSDNQPEAVAADTGRRQLLRSLGTPNSMLDEFDFWDGRYESRRLFSELFGTFLLVLVAVGGGMVNSRFGGSAVPYGALVVAPALMVAAIILFMGAVSGAHLNPVVSIAFALRRDFPWRRVPAYIAAQLLGAVLATLLLEAVLGKQGSAGLTLPGHGISTLSAMVWEIILTTGLVSTILGVSSGAQQLGSIAAIGVGSYIALAGLWGSPVSGASMNPARSLGPALVLADWTSWWAYLLGPLAGAIIAAGIAFILRGAGGGRSGQEAAEGTLGETWKTGPIGGSSDTPTAQPETAPDGRTP